MPLIPSLRRFVRPPPKALLLALPLLVAGCAYDNGYAVDYRPDPYYYSCLNCDPFFGPDFRYRHDYGYGHPGYGHGPGGHGSHR